MCTRQDNFLLHLNLPCLMECKMPELHGTTLLSAPWIFALPNCFGPGFLRTACLLSLSLPVSFTFRRRLTIHLLHPLAVTRASFGTNVLQPTLLVVPQSPLPAATARCRTTA